MKKSPFLYILILIAFLANSLFSVPMLYAQEFKLPVPGVMVPLSPDFNPSILKGIKVHSDNPFSFEFILDQGDSSLKPSKSQIATLVKYFMASLTIPESDLWVNLSPYEKDRIIPGSFGLTEMGRDLLAEDYLLKQITASLIYPENEIGKRFWKRIYDEAAQKYGTTNIPVNTFNKVWIVPEKAAIYENVKAGTAYVVDSKLTVMLEEDYLSLEKHSGVLSSLNNKSIATLGSQVIREIVIPELIKEVNEGKNFSQLRQVYNALILATWYKNKMKGSILAQVYESKKRVHGLGVAGQDETERIYQRYLTAFKKGVYNYIKDDVDTFTQERIPRKYFSGGVTMIVPKIEDVDSSKVPKSLGFNRAQIVNINFIMAKDNTRNEAMLTAKDPIVRKRVRADIVEGLFKNRISYFSLEDDYEKAGVTSFKYMENSDLTAFASQYNYATDVVFDSRGRDLLIDKNWKPNTNGNKVVSFYVLEFGKEKERKSKVFIFKYKNPIPGVQSFWLNEDYDKILNEPSRYELIRNEQIDKVKPVIEQEVRKSLLANREINLTAPQSSREFVLGDFIDPDGNVSRIHVREEIKRENEALKYKASFAFTQSGQRIEFLPNNFLTLTLSQNAKLWNLSEFSPFSLNVPKNAYKIRRYEQTIAPDLILKYLADAVHMSQRNLEAVNVDFNTSLLFFRMAKRQEAWPVNVLLSGDNDKADFLLDKLFDFENVGLVTLRKNGSQFGDLSGNVQLDLRRLPESKNLYKISELDNGHWGNNDIEKGKEILIYSDGACFDIDGHRIGDVVDFERTIHFKAGWRANSAMLVINKLKLVKNLGFNGMNEFIRFSHLWLSDVRTINFNKIPGHNDMRLINIRFKNGQKEFYYLKSKIPDPSIPQLMMLYDLGPEFAELEDAKGYNFIEKGVKGVVLKKENTRFKSIEDVLIFVRSMALACGQKHGLGILHSDLISWDAKAGILPKMQHIFIESKRTGGLVTRFIDTDFAIRISNPRDLRRTTEKLYFESAILNYVTKVDNAWMKDNNEGTGHDLDLNERISLEFNQAYSLGFEKTNYVTFDDNTRRLQVNDEKDAMDLANTLGRTLGELHGQNTITTVSQGEDLSSSLRVGKDLRGHFKIILGDSDNSRRNLKKIDFENESAKFQNLLTPNSFILTIFNNLGIAQVKDMENKLKAEYESAYQLAFFTSRLKRLEGNKVSMNEIENGFKGIFGVNFRFLAFKNSPFHSVYAIELEEKERSVEKIVYLGKLKRTKKLGEWINPVIDNSPVFEVAIRPGEITFTANEIPFLIRFEGLMGEIAERVYQELPHGTIVNVAQGNGEFIKAIPEDYPIIRHVQQKEISVYIDKPSERVPIKNSVHEASEGSPAMVIKGGIDLSKVNKNMHSKNDGEEFKFNLDPALLKRLQNASGFVPVIIKIRPMNNLWEFLGIPSS